jgi:hypothetical protein
VAEPDADGDEARTLRPLQPQLRLTGSPAGLAPVRRSSPSGVRCLRIGISNDISREWALFSPYFERSTARSQAINPPLH